MRSKAWVVALVVVALVAAAAAASATAAGMCTPTLTVAGERRERHVPCPAPAQVERLRRQVLGVPYPRLQLRGGGESATGYLGRWHKKFPLGMALYEVPSPPLASPFIALADAVRACGAPEA
jgi:hypothetical protein